VPELPEVQTIVNNLNDLALAGRFITAASVYWPKTISGQTPGEFVEKICGCKIRRISRRGKYMVFTLSAPWTLLVHLRMTGRLIWETGDRSRGKHEHVILQIDGKHELRFQDTRKFGRMTLTARPEKVLEKLGPEPLERSFTAERFGRLLHRHHRAVKPLLLDQTFVAGLGNIYVDEALWKSGIHPLRVSSSLSPKETAGLHRAVRYVLRKGLRNLGTTLGRGQANFYSLSGSRGRNAEKLFVFRRTGEACPRCGTPIERIKVAQRSTHVCPRCQHPRG
jgi:formamidopyrimidine-DNA glycosylase